jgi:hypothetical protein
MNWAWMSPMWRRPDLGQVSAHPVRACMRVGAGGRDFIDLGAGERWAPRCVAPSPATTSGWARALIAPNRGVPVRSERTAWRMQGTSTRILGAAGGVPHLRSLPPVDRAERLATAAADSVRRITCVHRRAEGPS